MGDINISRVEMDALKGVDAVVVDKPIERSLYEERQGILHHLEPANGSLYIASQLRDFERALAEHGKAKSAKNVLRQRSRPTRWQ